MSGEKPSAAATPMVDAERSLGTSSSLTKA